MARKLTPRSTPQDTGAATARNYPRQIWLAGLGALAVTQKESSRLFESLVQRGNELENDSLQAAETQLDEVRQQVSGTFNKLEMVFQDRVARALNGLGIPTEDDIHALSRRVDKLSQQIQHLQDKRDQRSKDAAA